MLDLAEKLLDLFVRVMEWFFQRLAEWLERFIDYLFHKNKHAYKADFVSEKDLLTDDHQGFCLTGKGNLSVKNSYQGALVVGGTGTGKSSITLLPSLYTMRSSFIVHDPSGELFSKSAGHLTDKGYSVRTLNFTNPIVSSGYNPLARVHSSSDIQKIASMLVANALGNNSKDPFWNTQATALLSMLITILKKQPEEYYNLYNVRQLLNDLGGGNTKAVDSLFSRHADSVLFSEYKSFIAYDEKVISGVIATCKAALQIFSDDSVAKVTSYDTLNLADFRNKKVALFVQNSIADQKYYSILTSIFFEQFFSYILSRFPKEEEQDIFFLIDEASSLKLPTLPLAVANVRKHRAGIMLIIQDFNQLVHTYGKHEADAIRANCFAKMFYTGQSLETAKELEQTLGRFEYRDDDGKVIVRPLMTNDEIRTMKKDQALLICGHLQPMKAKLHPYYENRKLRYYGEIPAPELYNHVSIETIPILPLDIPKPTDEAQ